MKFKTPDNAFIETIVNLNVAGQTINDVSNPSLFVEMEEATDNVTQKEDNFEKMLALINVISQINPSFVDIRTLIANAPVVGVEKMLEYIDQAMQSQAQASQEAAQLESTKANLENQKIERGMINDEQKLRIEQEKVNKSGKGK
jgi:hypothetical protein